jgi:hypothetical protein
LADDTGIVGPEKGRRVPNYVFGGRDLTLFSIGKVFTQHVFLTLFHTKQGF